MTFRWRTVNHCSIHRFHLLSEYDEEVSNRLYLVHGYNDVYWIGLGSPFYEKRIDNQTFETEDAAMLYFNFKYA